MTASSPSQTPVSPIEQNSFPLRETLSLLQKVKSGLGSIDPSTYHTPVSSHLSSIGAHLRHILDHVEALVEAGEASCAEVDYQKRVRDTPAEHLVAAGIERLDGLVQRALALKHVCPSAPLVVSQICASSSSQRRLESSWQREWAFVASHTVHHMAAIAFVAEVHGLRLPEDFGVAASTLSHRQQSRRDESA